MNSTHFWIRLRRYKEAGRSFRRIHAANARYKTHFGFNEVTEEEKRDKVLNVFNNVSNKYDVMNDVMSGGIHRLWKEAFIQMLNPSPGTKLLDVAGGTGDIAFHFLNFTTKKCNNCINNSHVVVCDINESMLEIGKEKAIALGISNENIDFIKGDAQCLKFENDTFDAYTITFGIRNVVSIDKALAEAYRVLKPGGRFLCLEFSVVNEERLKSLYDWYSFNIIPPIGEVVTGDWSSYQYLVESIRKFPSQEEFKKMVENAGFTPVKYTNLWSGLVAIHSGFKI